MDSLKMISENDVDFLILLDQPYNDLPYKIRFSPISRIGHDRLKLRYASREKFEAI